MLESIHLKDFQSHVDTTIELDPLFNIICGASGTGKSAIIRALKYLAFNNAGTGEVRCPDAKSYVIDVKVNKHTITREKGESVNSYTVDGNTFIDVNRDVPPSVANALNIKQVPLDTTFDLVIQFADQMDAPFMLSEKDSIKMKFLNILSGTNAVDLAAKEATQLVKENTKISKETTERLKVLQEQKKQLEAELLKVKNINKYLKKKTEELTELKAQVEPLNKLQDQANYLFNAYSKIRLMSQICAQLDLNKLGAEIDRLINLTKLFAKKTDFNSRYIKVREFSRTLNDLTVDGIDYKIDKLISLKTVSNDVSDLKAKYFALKEIHTLLGSVDISKIEDMLNKLEGADALANRYISIKQELSAVGVMKNDLAAKLDTEVVTYKNLLMQEQVCPLCGNALTKNCVDEALKFL